MVSYQLVLTFLARVISEFRANYAFLLPPGQFRRLSTLQTTLFPSLAPASLPIISSSSSSLVSTNTALTLDGSLLQGLDAFHRADEEAHPLILLLSGVLEYQIVSLALPLRHPLSLLAAGLRSIWKCSGDDVRAGIDALSAPDSVFIFTFGLLLFSILWAVIFWSSHSRHVSELYRGINVGSVLNHVSSTVSVVWDITPALLQRFLDSWPTSQVPGFLKHILQPLESSLDRTGSGNEPLPVAVFLPPTDGRRRYESYARRRALSPIREEWSPTSSAVSCAALATLESRSEHRQSERREVVITASSPGTTTFEPRLPVKRQAVLMDQYVACIDSDSSEELRSPVFCSSDPWKLSEDDPDALALVAWRGSEQCIRSIEEAYISEKAIVANASQPISGSFWEQQYHLHDTLRNNSEERAVLDLAANNLPPQWSDNVTKSETRSSFINMRGGLEHRTTQHQIDRHRRVFTEPRFPSVPSVLGAHAGLQPLPAFQSLKSMVRYLELCLRQPEFGRTLSTSTQQSAEVRVGNVLVLASRAELRKTKSAGDVHKRWLGPKAFLVFSQSSAKSQPLSPVVSPAATGSTPSVLLRRSSSLHEMAPKRSRHTLGPNGATNPFPPFRHVQSAACDTRSPPEVGENLLAMPRLCHPPITPISRPLPRRLARHSFPLAASHQHTRTESRSGAGGGGQRNGQHDAPGRRAHSAGLGAPAAVLQTSASATKALVAATVGAAALEPELTGGASEAGEEPQVPVYVRRAWIQPLRPTALPGVVSVSLARPSVVSTPVYRLHGLSGIAHRSPMWGLKPLVLAAGAPAEAGDEYVLSTAALQLRR